MIELNKLPTSVVFYVSYFTELNSKISQLACVKEVSCIIQCTIIKITVIWVFMYWIPLRVSGLNTAFCWESVNLRKKLRYLWTWKLSNHAELERASLISLYSGVSQLKMWHECSKCSSNYFDGGPVLADIRNLFPFGYWHVSCSHICTDLCMCSHVCTDICVCFELTFNYLCLWTWSSKISSMRFFYYKKVRKFNSKPKLAINFLLSISKKVKLSQHYYQ